MTIESEIHFRWAFITVEPVSSLYFLVVLIQSFTTLKVCSCVFGSSLYLDLMLKAEPLLNL